MSARHKLTIVVLMPFVITRRDHTSAHVNLGTWETEGNVQVIKY